MKVAAGILRRETRVWSALPQRARSLAAGSARGAAAELDVRQCLTQQHRLLLTGFLNMRQRNFELRVCLDGPIDQKVLFSSLSPECLPTHFDSAIGTSLEAPGATGTAANLGGIFEFESYTVIRSGLRRQMSA